MISDTAAPLALPPALHAALTAARSAPATVAAAQRAIGLLDFTLLDEEGDEAAVAAFCRRALTPAGPVAAVCVYPRFLPAAARLLAGTGVRITTVCNFPDGDADAGRAAAEIAAAIAAGAEEVDIVFPYAAFLAGDAAAAAALVAACRRACGAGVRLKVILETGLLPDAAAITAAGRIAIDEGADFLKTSTGKRGPGATLEAGALLLDLVRATRDRTGRTVGFKPSGGVRSAAQAARFLALADAMIGPDFAVPATFRFGASGLLADLLARLGHGQAQPAAPAAGGY